MTKADEKITKRKALCAKVQATLIRNGQAIRTTPNPNKQLALTDGSVNTGNNNNNENSDNIDSSLIDAETNNKGSLVGDFTLLSADSATTPMNDKVNQFSALLKERTQRLKALQTELDMYQQQVTVDAEELSELEKEYKQLKKV